MISSATSPEHFNTAVAKQFTDIIINTTAGMMMNDEMQPISQSENTANHSLGRADNIPCVHTPCYVHEWLVMLGQDCQAL